MGRGATTKKVEAEAAAPARSLEYREVGSLKKFERNARTHSAGQVRDVARSIERFGWTSPVLHDVSEGIVAGHGRVEAASLLYSEGKRLKFPNGDPIPDGCVPILDCTGWSNDDRRAYIIADNKLALNAGWNEELLAVELDELRDLSFDMSLLGFQRFELNSLIGTPNDPSVEWKGMPGFNQGDKTAFRSIPVHFADQDAVDKFAALIGQPITQQTRYVWFPEVVIERYADKVYKQGATEEAAS